MDFDENELPLALPLSYEDKELWLADGDSLIHRRADGTPYVHDDAAAYIVRATNNFDNLLYTLYQARRNIQNIMDDLHHEDHLPEMTPRWCPKCYLNDIHNDIDMQLKKLDKHRAHDPFLHLEN